MFASLKLKQKILLITTEWLAKFVKLTGITKQAKENNNLEMC